MPEPHFSFVTAPCDSTIHFHDSTIYSGTSSVARWQWNFGDGSPQVVILAPGPGDTSHVYVNSGIYEVKLTVTNIHGCVDSLTRSVQRFPCIKAGFSYPDTLGCAGYRIAFSDTSLPVARIKQWHWTWDDGTDTTYTKYKTPIYHTFADSGSYNVSLEVQSLVNGTTITDNTMGRVKIHPTPETRFSNPPVCLGEISLFADTSKTYGENIIRWNWTFGSKAADTSSLPAPGHKYPVVGTYDVKLVVMNRFGCKDSLSKPTRVHGLPVAHYSNTAGCSGDPVFFTDKSIAGDTALGSWRWFFGDPATLRDSSNLRNPFYSYPHTGDYTIRMIVKDMNGCSDSVESSMLVHQSPIAAFTITENVSETPGKIRLNNESGNHGYYRWDYGNGKGTDLEENPIVQYTEDTTAYIITLIVKDTATGCSDTTFLRYEFLFDNLFVPNAFAPTYVSSAKNWQDIREFKPKGLNLQDYHVMVFDKWGHLIWESSKLDCDDQPTSCKGSPVQGWDGTFNGEPMPQDVYMWKISATFKNGKVWEGSDTGKGSTTTMGTVTLIR